MDLFFQHQYTHPANYPDIERTDMLSISEEVEAFLAGLETETREPLIFDGRDEVFRTAAEFKTSLVEIRAFHTDVLGEDIVFAVDEQVRRLELAEMAERSAMLPKRTPRRRTEIRRIAYGFLGEGLRDLITAVDPLLGAGWQERT